MTPNIVRERKGGFVTLSVAMPSRKNAVKIHSRWGEGACRTRIKSKDLFIAKNSM